MGKPTGFLEYERKENTDVPVSARITNFREFHEPLTPEVRRTQGARCMNCGVPFCQSAMKLNGMVTGCPLHNLIPEWNDMHSTVWRRPRTSQSSPEECARPCARRPASTECAARP